MISIPSVRDDAMRCRRDISLALLRDWMIAVFWKASIAAGTAAPAQGRRSNANWSSTPTGGCSSWAGLSPGKARISLRSLSTRDYRTLGRGARLAESALSFTIFQLRIKAKLTQMELFGTFSQPCEAVVHRRSSTFSRCGRTRPPQHTFSAHAKSGVPA